MARNHANLDASRMHTPYSLHESCNPMTPTPIHLAEWDIREIILSAQGLSAPSLRISDNPDLQNIYLEKDKAATFQELIQAAIERRPDLQDQIIAIAQSTGAVIETIETDEDDNDNNNYVETEPEQTKDLEEPASEPAKPKENPKISSAANQFISSQKVASAPYDSPQTIAAIKATGHDFDPLSPPNAATGLPFRDGESNTEGEVWVDGYGFQERGYKEAGFHPMRDEAHNNQHSNLRPLNRVGRPQNLTNRKGQMVRGVYDLTQGRNVSQMWEFLFERNESVALPDRLTDEDLVEIMKRSFPQKTNKTFTNVVQARCNYNAGRLACQIRAPHPKLESFRYIRATNGSDIIQLTPRGRIVDGTLTAVQAAQDQGLKANTSSSAPTLIDAHAQVVNQKRIDAKEKLDRFNSKWTAPETRAAKRAKIAQIKETSLDAIPGAKMRLEAGKKMRAAKLEHVKNKTKPKTKAERKGLK